MWGGWLIKSLFRGAKAEAKAEKAVAHFGAQRNKEIRKFGIGKDIIKLPDDFYEHFDDMNDEIAAMFYGES